ncbi:hypothetical protein S1OALGB6SA_1899 [Olavius algarvensis spirochete endosymbiont]|uniref:FMN-binding protein n=1 Tax=Olavius algarvensis spirochete endosymbiont TaxID=260710 RepID=UPI00052B6101|nr:FMN-binding protein [Olavius algarvensis spirochete endosymbiont]KGM38806.1 hypothetical protein JY97_14560 [Alkalispirochaeta odontotermitis]VDB00809.1 hypothetical protein S1OALGB6SA_1899 [Olavius algarvensis spirochete endosymbiont]
MTDITEKALKLGLIGALAALLLAVLNSFVAPIIELRREAEMRAVLDVLANGEKTEEAETVSEPGILQRWRISNDKGWILEMEAVGYGGPMLLAASYKSDGTIVAARLMDNKETVGFGKKAEDSAYMKVFEGFGGEISIPQSRTELANGADLVSGATITFTGIAVALEKGSKTVKEWSNQR